MTARFEWERLFLAESGLAAPARLIGLVLATRVDPDMAIPARFSPSLSVLVKLTGLSRSALAEHLNRMEAAGWVVRERPATAAALSRGERTGYALTIPADLSTENARTSPGDGLGVVREADGGSPGSGHKPSLSISSSITFAEADASGAPAGARSRPSGDDEQQLEAALLWVEEQAGGFLGAEESTARGMLEGGSNRVAVLNKLRRMRGNS